MSGPYEELWTEIETRLRAVVDSLGTRLSEDRALILDFVDHNEFGVAFEMLRDALIDGQSPVSQKEVAELIHLAQLMKIDARESAFRRDSAELS